MISFYSAGFMQNYPQFRQLLGRHPGLVPLLRIDTAAATELTDGAAHNQAAAVTLREGLPGDGYEPARKQQESFQPSFSPAGNLGFRELDPLRPNQPHVSHYDRAVRQLSGELADADYLARHPEVRDTLARELSLRNEVVSPRIADERALRSYLAESARRQTQAPLQPDLATLKADPDLAAWIATDRAGIAKEMSTYGEVASRLNATDSWSHLREQIADTAAAWFEEDSPLTDRFFVEYPTAAYYLSENPRVLEELQQHNDKALSFTARFERIHQRLLPGLAELAAQRAASPGQYNQRWFELHQEQAILVETGRRLLPEQQLESAFSGQPRQSEYSDQRLAGGWERLAAAETLDQTDLPADWTEKHAWLPRLLNRSEEFTGNLLKLADELARELEREDNPVDSSWWTLRLAEALDTTLPSLRLDTRV